MARLLAAASLLVLAPLASAQLPSELIGGAANTTGLIQRQNGVCTPSALCSPVLGLPPQPWAGGTAFDPIRSVVWNTDGVNLVGMPAQSTACIPVCGPMPVPGLTPGVFATGLAFQEDGSPNGVLWCVDSLHILRRFSWSGGCPTLGTQCSLASYITNPFTYIGGLAISEVHNKLFFVASDFSTAGPSTTLFIAPLNNPCTVLCALPLVITVPGLIGRQITGLAFDDGNDMLFFTDGPIVFWAQYFPSCGIGPFGACSTALADAYYGLDVEPHHAVPLGQSCLTAPCPSCLGMRLDAVGDATLGNNQFGFRLTGGPAGAFCFGFWNVGCIPAPGIPALCGSFHVPVAPPLIPFGAPFVLAGAGCAGTVFRALPIPLNPSLYGIPVSAQEVIVCGSGMGLSNAVCATISDT